MGILKRLFRRRSRASLQQLPLGSLTVNRKGEVVTSTVSSSYPKSLLREIAGEVLRLFREAREAQIPMAELSLHYASLRITARELRGGAIIFIFPHTALTSEPN